MSHLNQDELDIYSKELKHLSQLKHLAVHYHCILEDQEIEERIFNDLFVSNTLLQSFQCQNDDLVRNKHMCDIEKRYFSPSSYSPATAQSKKVLSELTDITIQLRSFQDIIWLFTIAPNVKILKVNLYTSCADGDYQNIRQQLQTFIQPKNLEELHLTGYIEEFHFLQLLFQRLSFSGGGKLRRLYLNNRAVELGVNNDKHSFINGNRWQPLVIDLDEFHCSLCVHLNNSNDDEKQLTSFRTPFWLDEKKFYFKNFYRRDYYDDCDDDDIYEEVFYLETIPYHFSNMNVKPAEKITTTNQQKILSPYRHVTSLDCTWASLQVNVNFMLECRLNIKQLELSFHRGSTNHTELDQLELSFPKLKHLTCYIPRRWFEEPHEDAEYSGKFAIKLLTLSPNLHYLNTSMETISEISRLKQEQQIPPFCTRLKYLEIYGYKELISKEIDEIQDVFEQLLHKIEYLKVLAHLDRVLPCKSLLKTLITQILNSFTNLHCLTIEYRSWGLNSKQYPKDEQLESNVKQWVIDNTRLKDINKYYVDCNDDNCLTILM